MSTPVGITFLGGLGQIGRNCAALEIDGQVLLIDCGQMFGDDTTPGVDTILPDFSFLHEKGRRVIGCIATHGHEDHIGGLPYLLRDLSFPVYGTPFTVRAGEWFIAFSMAVLALLKLQDVESFSTMFLNYDLLAKRWVPYSYVYPFAEGLAGILMIAGVLTWLSVPVALFIGTVGAVSVFKAVYVDRRELKCACVGGSSNVPLGFVSLTENLMMIAMAVWMALGAFGLLPAWAHGM